MISKRKAGLLPIPWPLQLEHQTPAYQMVPSGEVASPHRILPVLESLVLPCHASAQPMLHTSFLHIPLVKHWTHARISNSSLSLPLGHI